MMAVVRARSISSSPASAVPSATLATTRSSSRLRRRSSSTFLRSVTSTRVPRRPSSRSSESTHDCPRASSHRTVPSGQTTRAWIRCTCPVLDTASATAAWNPARSSGWMRCTTCGSRVRVQSAPSSPVNRRPACADHHMPPVPASISQIAIPAASRASARRAWPSRIWWRASPPGRQRPTQPRTWSQATRGASSHRRPVMAGPSAAAPPRPRHPRGDCGRRRRPRGRTRCA